MVGQAVMDTQEVEIEAAQMDQTQREVYDKDVVSGLM